MLSSLVKASYLNVLSVKQQVTIIHFNTSQCNVIKTLQYQREDHTETGKKSEHKTNCTGDNQDVAFFFRWKILVMFHYVVSKRVLKKTSVQWHKVMIRCSR